ncbi:hypothetical protein Y1Q_0011781 [Alligator mississippiensis]|uniref:Uncharacterized protein n=1 Tax=Alligator mississippiensis TaxID=8496 RepID=A0A151M128_ALLMI|nr:hypothetical protein Y1Q_0011781 [Alligator mississippiensis]
MFLVMQELFGICSPCQPHIDRPLGDRGSKQPTNSSVEAPREKLKLTCIIPMEAEFIGDGGFSQLLAIGPPRTSIN